jgi:GxxExxY protein
MFGHEFTQMYTNRMISFEEMIEKGLRLESWALVKNCNNVAANSLIRRSVKQVRQKGCIIISKYIRLILNVMEILHKESSYRIIGLAMQVHSRLGTGFLEKVYENALMLLLKREGVNAKQQHSIKVYFEDQIVGDYIADILIDESIILEIKALDYITDVHRAQALNYLRATELRLAIILNFGKKTLQYERLVL